MNWTVAAETPDTVYYQSFKAYGLGWKIKVLNEGEEPSFANPSPASVYTEYLISLMCILILRTFFKSGLWECLYLCFIQIGVLTSNKTLNWLSLRDFDIYWSKCCTVGTQTKQFDNWTDDIWKWWTNCI